MALTAALYSFVVALSDVEEGDKKTTGAELAVDLHYHPVIHSYPSH